MLKIKDFKCREKSFSNLVDGGMLPQCQVPETATYLITTLANCKHKHCKLIKRQAKVKIKQ